MSLAAGHRKELAACAGNKVQWDCPLAPYTSFGIGGPADALVEIGTVDECAALLRYCIAKNLSWRVIGRGTNLLVPDSGFRGVILMFNGGMSGISMLQETGAAVSGVLAGAGCSLAQLVSWYTENSFSGLEFAIGIPGSVGGAVIMNAGACGGELADRLVAIDVFTLAGGVERLGREQLDFRYRYWENQGTGDGRRIVLAARFSVSPGNKEQIQARCRANLERRKVSQPKGLKSGGSFFKNPPGDSAGRLIEASGLKGRQCGGAMISELHANFLVNTGGATASDVLRLMDMVTHQVLVDSGVQLIPEVHFL